MVGYDFVDAMSESNETMTRSKPPKPFSGFPMFSVFPLAARVTQLFVALHAGRCPLWVWSWAS